MPTKRCCCGTPSCVIGSDDFNRADNTDPGPKWRVLAGDANIVGNKIEVSGTNAIVATTICHPSSYVLGSWQATFTLVNLRTVGLFEVGAGKPDASPWRVQFVPSGMDTVDARITVRVLGSGGWEEFEFLWVDDVFGNSANTMEVSVCYEPGALLRGSVGIPPAVDNCIELQGWEAACYAIGGGPNVGNFFFTAGHFDNWSFETTILDNFACPICGCFCFKREGSAKDWNCYPEVMCLILEQTSGPANSFDGASFILTQGQGSPGDGWPEKQSWFSAVESCVGSPWAFVADCRPIVKDGVNWFLALQLRLTDSSYLASGNAVWEWVDPDINVSTRSASFEASTCDPLDLVFPNLRLKSFFGPCGPPSPPGVFGHYLFCGDNTCHPTAPDVRFSVRIVECP